ncbi:glycosyltransferase family 4 protein [Candidatus Gottesmanbacteria bacterium]|nr:glycosyltransferase family 4 protein [Candidatus Gottesmanbacteria bacterium]
MMKGNGNGRPKILFLYDFPLHGGGSGAYVKYLALRLVERYHYKDKIAIAAPEKHVFDPRIPIFPIKLPQIPVFIGRPGLPKSKRYAELNPSEIADLYKGFIDGTIEAVNSFKPDIIHVHHVAVNSWAARFVRSIFGIKFIVTSHGSCIHAISRDRRYFRLSRDALNAASAITVVSGDTRAKLIKMFGTNLSQKTRTIPGGIPLSMFPIRKNTDGLRKELGLQGKKIALFTGRIISEKGVAYLVKAAKNIHGQVVIAGDGPQKKFLEQMIKDMNLKNVTMLGFFNDPAKVIDLYYLSDVFVSPAVWDEPLGLTTIEAMASSTPVIVTRKGGTVMAIKDGVNGIFVRPRNSKEIVREVNGLFTNEEKCRKMGLAARKTVEEKFTWTKIAERFDSVYRGLVRNK